MRIKSIKFQIILTILMVFFVLYPNPIKLGLSLYRVISPPIDSEEVLRYPVNFVDNDLTPRKLEALIIENIPYQYDWTTYRMPWYYPSVSEVVENQAGDCKSRLVVFASMLEHRGDPYTIKYSLDHFWVDYPNKIDTTIENESVAIYTQDEGFRMPDIQWDVTLNTYTAFWDYMPLDIKIAFSLAWILPGLLTRVTFEIRKSIYDLSLKNRLLLGGFLNSLIIVS